MRISRPKIQLILFKFGPDNGHGREPVKILGEELQRVHRFKYLGSSVEQTGGMATEISHRVSAAWGNWKRCSGVLCDSRMPVKLKGKVYTTVVRPALLYGAETWATTRGHYCIVLIALSRCNRVFTRRLRLCHSNTVYRREVRKGDREGPNRVESEV